MNTPSRSNLFLEDDDRDLSPLNNTRKDSLMDVLASRKGSGTKDAKSQKKKRSEK
jgi:hypothetical protein